MTQVVGPARPVALSGHGRSAGWAGRAAAAAVVAVSVFGGVFPFFSDGLGLPLDGYPDGVVTLWRTVLHIAPGALGLAAGAVLMSRAGERAVLAACRLALAVGAWFMAGPYVWSLVQPAHAMGTGGLSGMPAGVAHGSWIAMVAMPEPPGHAPMTVSTANCVFTVGVCHWAVGALVIVAAMVVMADRLGRGPLIRMGLARAALR